MKARRRRWTRRQRLVVRTLGLSVLGLAFIVGLVLFWPSPTPYVPGEAIEGITNDLSRQMPSDYPPVKWIDATEEAGIDFRHFHGTRSMQLPEDMGSGAAWGDYDNDGFLDLYIVNEAGPLTQSPTQVGASPAHNALYHNSGDGTFLEVSQPAKVDYRGCGQAAAWGDYDNDGFLDLCVTNYGEILLYHNAAGDTFTATTSAAGIDTASGFWAGTSWGDYDRDGDLDLYICGYVQYYYDSALVQSQTRQYDTLIPATLNPSTYRPERNLLYSNNGDGTFVEIASNAGVKNSKGRSLSASWSDFDGDGWIDLYVANDLSDNALLKNLGDGTFVDVSHNAWVADYRGAMGLAVGDWNLDGDQDLFITHWIAQENAFFDNLSADYRQANLSQQDVNLHFMDVADQLGLGQIALGFVGWGTAFTDYDNDGLLDLFVVNGSTFSDKEDPRFLIPMRNQLFWNRGIDKGYFDVSAVSGSVFEKPNVGRGLALGDYDSDGDADAFVVVNGGQGLLLRNEGGNHNNWLKVRLKGNASNRSGFGVKLGCVVGNQLIYRESGSSSSYYSQHAVGEVLFGLGEATLIDTLSVHWPSGTEQVLIELEVNQTIWIEEASD